MGIAEEVLLTHHRRKLYTAIFLVLACASLLCRGAEAQLEKRITTQLLNAPGEAGVAVGDFNSDGKLDVVAVVKDVQIFLGNGDGTFQPPTNYVVGANPNSVTVADFTGGNLQRLVHRHS